MTVMTTAQAKQVHTLAKKQCCNYTPTGGCLLLDDACALMASQTRCNCRYFRQSVLPLDPKLNTEIIGSNIVKTKAYNKTCKTCGKSFTSSTKNKINCPSCEAKNNRERYKKYNKKRELKTITY